MLRRHAEAEHYYDLSISMAPDQFSAYYHKAWNLISWKGDPAAALAELSEIPIEAGPEATEARCLFLIFSGDYSGALEVLKESPHEVLNTIVRFSLRSELEGRVHFLMGNEERARAAFDSARVMLETELARRPDDYRVRGPLGIVYAHLGRREDAIREGRTSVELCPVSKDALVCPWAVLDLAGIYAIVGEYDAAIDQAEYLLSIPSAVTVKWFELDPRADPFRSNPRMQVLMREYSLGS
jgi:tetratricopeptide (TPR) repeat protein